MAVCRTCGAPFVASRTGYTVNCPAHRGRAAPTTRATVLVPAMGRACTVGPTAVEHRRCGKPAVAAFKTRDGRTFYECADHAPSGS